MSALPKTGILGYGRFGRALGGRLREAGASVLAHDPQAPPDPEVAAESIEALVEASELLVLAVPLVQMESVLAELVPFLGPHHVVMDVGSVKTKPAAMLERVLGAEIPWVSTHPLFGPVSLALGEPSRVVVCPNPLHPEAVVRVTELYEELGCEVISEDAATHDRIMARTHALVYFIAKGLLDADACVTSPLAPPSVKAIARTVESVREDGGHLFASLHSENPFAGEARQELLDALTSVDRALADQAQADAEAPEAGALRIQEAEGPPPRLLEAREVIDSIDDEILALLARRANVSLWAARVKAEVGRGVRDPRREQELLETRRRAGGELGLDENSVNDIFQAILRFSRGHQTQSEAGAPD